MDVQEDTPQPSSASEQVTGARDVAPDDPSQYADQVPGGRYHIVDRLSSSAIGAVYKALDTVLDRPVAVKCVRLDTPLAEQGPDELRERFVREARVASRLQHPNIVTIHDIVATDERGYIIMEFIEGRTLESLVESERRLPLSTAIKVLAQLSSALDYAHSRNVVHRDVKPSNILVSPSMYVWVTDFGIAKSELSTNLTMAGGVLGAPDYMSPEQAKGEDVDARSDLFSLGCILFESVVGEKPFRSPSLTGVLLSIINDEPVFPLNWRTLGLPMELKPILHHALEKNREKRFASGASMMVALEAISKEAVDSADVAAGARPAGEASAATTAEPRSSEHDAPQEDASQLKVEAKKAEAKKAEAEKAEAEKVEAKKAEAEKAEAGKAEAEKAEAEKAEAEKAEAEKVEAEKAEAEKAEAEKAEAEKAEAEKAEAEKTEAGKAEAGKAEAGKAEAEKVEAEKAEAEKAEAEKAEAEKAELERDAVTLEQIESMKDESQVLHLSPTLSSDLRGVEISPEEGFLLSRIDGASRPNDIISVSPLAESDTVQALLDLLDKGLIRLGGVTREVMSVPVRAPEPAPPARIPKRPAGPDASTVAEVDRLLDSAKSQNYPDLLGLTTDAPEAKRKSAYLKIVARFHPDKFPGADKEFRAKLTSLCASASDAVTDFEKHLGKTGSGGNGSTFSGNGGAPAPFDRQRHARALHDRARSAYDRADYWDAIQLGRQAVEADGQVAQFHGLLGRALLQNKKWRKEAADTFLKATQLEPGNVEYLGFLAAIYQSEGLATRASSLLDKALAIDPDFELPNIDETEVTVD